LTLVTKKVSSGTVLAPPICPANSNLKAVHNGSTGGASLGGLPPFLNLPV
jgi:hypothetical protein